VITVMLFICVAALVHLSGLLLDGLMRRPGRRDDDEEIQTERPPAREAAHLSGQ
jgi:hypothetical protein